METFSPRCRRVEEGRTKDLLFIVSKTVTDLCNILIYFLTYALFILFKTQYLWPYQSICCLFQGEFWLSKIYHAFLSYSVMTQKPFGLLSSLAALSTLQSTFSLLLPLLSMQPILSHIPSNTTEHLNRHIK